jgi:ornithine cyclodeaminase
VHLAFDGASLAPIAVLEAGTLTLLRTAGLSAVAVRHLAPASARSLVVFGTGPQSVAHALAINSVRPLEHVSVIGRRPESVEAVIEQLRCGGLAARPGSLADVQVADIVACCTTAADPLFDSSMLLPEATVVAVGSHSPTRREVDAALVRSATVIVESRKSALAQAGDIVLALAEGVPPASAIDGDLSELVRGDVSVAESRPRLFKSVGEAWADVVVASAAVREVLTPTPVL